MAVFRISTIHRRQIAEVIVIPVFIVGRPVGVSERFVLLTIVVDDAEDVVAAVGVAVERDCVRVVGGHDHQCLVEVDVAEGGRNRVVQFGELGEGELSVVVVVRVVDTSALHHQHEAVRVSTQEANRLRDRQRSQNTVNHGNDSTLELFEPLTKSSLSLIGHSVKISNRKKIRVE